MITYIYYSKKLRHEVHKYPTCTYANLQRRILFFWWNVDRRRFNTKPEANGKKWIFEWLAKGKNGEGRIISGDRFHLENELKTISQKYAH